jgi:polysaccharide pyruvyl transferase WcaK-like protein
MLAATILVLKRAWPEAPIGVVTGSRTRLSLLGLSVTPLRPGGTHSTRLPRAVPAVPRGVLDTWWSLAQRRVRVYGAAHALGELVPRRGARFAPEGGPELTIAVGGGYVCDMDEQRAIDVLELLADASRSGGVTAMCSQGVGPISSELLSEWVSKVVPEVDLVMLRERVTGRPLLERLGMPPERIVVPGDDAILLSRPPLPAADRRPIGVSLRDAPYLALHGSEDEIGRGIALAAARLRAPLRPVTSCEWADEDRSVNRRVAQSSPVAEPDIRRSAGPADFADALRRCGVVVTSLYHAAVFAISQGVPAVCLATSGYPMSKYEGLADLYGGLGLTVIDVSHGADATRIAEAIETAWETSDGLPAELATRTEVIQAAILAEYQRLTEVVARRFDHIAEPEPVRGIALGTTDHG